jgi:hypothetical protein
MVGKDEHARLLLTHEAASEQGDDATQLLQRFKDRGLKVTAACSDDSHRFTAAIKAVSPSARLQADHCHTVKHVWGHLKQWRLSSRRQVKASGAAQQDEACIAVAKQLWPLRWSLLKKPSNVSAEEKPALAGVESEEAGCVHSFRTMIRHLVNIFDHTHSEAPIATTEAGHPRAGRPSAEEDSSIL